MRLHTGLLFQWMRMNRDSFMLTTRTRLHERDRYNLLQKIRKNIVIQRASQN